MQVVVEVCSLEGALACIHGLRLRVDKRCRRFFLSGCSFLLSLFLRVLAALAESNMHVGSHSSALFDARSVEEENGNRNVEEH